MNAYNAITKLASMKARYGVVNPACLTGNSNAKVRQEIMTVWHGTKKPLAQCGINAMMQDLFTACNIPRDCYRNMERNLLAIIERAAI